MLLLWTTTALARCLTTSTVGQIEAHLAAAESAWAGLDGEAFDASLDEAVLLLPCLAEIAPPSFAARYHRMIALRAWGARDAERATWSLTAARTLDPAYTFPPDLLAPDHELNAAYAALPTAPGPARRPPLPKGGELWFDGVGRDAPIDRATIAQVRAADGSVATHLVRPGEDLPPYDAVPRVRNRILAGSAVALAAGLGCYAAAWGVRAGFYDPDAGHDVDDLRGIAARTQVLTGLAVGGVALAAGGAGVAFVVGGS